MMHTSASGTRQRRKNREQRELITEKSSSLFWEKGYAETSMRDIAQECGFRPANIYNFFENKESILFTILHEEMEEILEPIRALEHDEVVDPREALHKVIDNHVRLTLGERSASKLLFDSGLNNLSPANKKRIISLRDEYDRIANAIILRGVGRGMFMVSDVKLAVYGMASMIARSRIWYKPKGKYSIDEIIEFIYSFSLRGLGADPSWRTSAEK
jgi:AcrR family transcriptional regulator